jgi:hypothetical protein
MLGLGRAVEPQRPIESGAVTGDLVVPSPEMALPTAPARARLAGRLRLGVLALVALLAGHTAIYAVQYGTDARFAQAMSASGHDGWWGPASLLVLAIGFALLVRAVGGLAHLELRARVTSPIHSASRDGRAHYWSEVGSIWRRLTPLVAGLFLVQENLELFVAHGKLLGLDPLGGPGYPLALPILGALTLGLSLLGALVRWRVAVLRARTTPMAVSEPRRTVASAAHGRWRTIGALAPRRWMPDRLDAGRAPPQVLRP